MLIKKMTLDNFRMYKHEEIEFSTDRDKNITVILGDNTFGKTTLANAFVWCLYGINRFTDQILYNKDARYAIPPNDIGETKVFLELEHNNCNYKITTIQRYKKNSKGVDVTPVSYKPTTSIVKTDLTTHETYVVPATSVESEIESILDKKLVDYFFFDGEVNTVKSVSSRSNLSYAVLDLLNVKRIKDIQELFNPNLADSVYSNLNPKPARNALGDGFDNGSNLSSKIAEQQKEYGKINEEILDYDDEIKRLESDKESKEIQLDNVQDILQYQNEKRKLDSRLEDSAPHLKNAFDSMIHVLNANSGKALLSLLFAKSFKKFNIEKMLNSTSFDSNSSYAGITEEGVNALISRGYCICGAPIQNGSDAYNHLVEAKNHMEPHDYGKYVEIFLSPEATNVENSSSTYEDVISSARKITDYIKELNDCKKRSQEIKEIISGHEDYGHLQREITELASNIGRLNSEKSYCNKHLSEVSATIDNLQRALERQTINDKNVAYLEKCKRYVKFIYNAAKIRMDDSNEEIRSSLEKEVQKVFDRVFHGERIIKIDDKFNVKTLHTDNTKLDTSSGLDIVTNFSFVVGLMNLAKNYIVDSKQDYFADDEVIDNKYPLVLDAPFSDLDLTHIRNLCDVFSTDTNQTILVVMEKDFNHADDLINEHIGKKYFIKQISETHSTLVEDK